MAKEQRVNIIQEYHFSNVISAKISFVINVVKMMHIEDILPCRLFWENLIIMVEL